MSCPHGMESSSCEQCNTDESFADAKTLVRGDPGPGAPGHTPIAGSRIGRFSVLEVVGRGGMGVVLSAFDPALDRRVAIKLIRGTATSARNAENRLAREAQAMARLTHPNVVPVYDVGLHGDSLFVAMEFVAGHTLQDWLKAKPRTWREALAVMLQAGRGLEAAHKAGIVHRDFKPANVLVGEDGRVRVSDFGLARGADDAEHEGDAATPSSPGLPRHTPSSLDAPLTQAGAVMGSPGYMAPEQYLGRPTTPATDQYAFCVTLYEALCGRRAFEGTDLAALSRQAERAQFAAPPEHVPAWLMKLVLRGLSPDATKRHPSMTALLEALSRDPSVSRRRLAVAALTVMLAAITAGAVAVWPALRARDCARDTRRLVVWNDEARAKVEHAFGEVRGEASSTALDFTRTALVTYQSEWSATRDELCLDGYERGALGPVQLAARLACLDRRRADLSSLIDQLTKGNSESIGRAAGAVAQLTPISRCLESADERLPSKTEEALEQTLTQVRVLRTLGQYDAARLEADRATTSARALGDARTLAVVLHESGALARTSGRWADSRVTLEESMALALSTGDERTALHDVALLISLVGWRLGKPDEGLALEQVGRGLASHVKDAWLEALLEEGVGDAHWRRQQRRSSLEAYQRALGLFVQTTGAASLDAARMHSAIGWLRAEAGDLAEAEAAFREAMRIRERLLGPASPEFGVSLNDVAMAAELSGETAQAAELLSRSLEVRRATQREPIVLLRAELNLARPLILLGRLDEAETILERSKERLDHDFSDGAPLIAVPQYFLYRAYLERRRGRPAAALEAAGKALEAARPQLDTATSMGAAIEVARLLAELGRDDEARVAFAEARREAARDGELRSAEYATLLFHDARHLRRIGRVDEALEVAKSADDVARSLERNDFTKVVAKVELARALEAARQPAVAGEALAAARALAKTPALQGLVTQAQPTLP